MGTMHLNRPSRPQQDRGFRPRPHAHRDEPYVSRNDPLPEKPKDATPKEPAHKELEYHDVFVLQRLGHVVIFFSEEDNSSIKAKHSHGYIIVKPRGQAAMTGYFRLTGPDGPLTEALTKKQVMHLVEHSFKLPREARLVQVHYNPPKG